MGSYIIMFTAFIKSRKFIKTLSAFLVNNQILQENTLKQKVIPIQRSSTTKYIYIFKENTCNSNL